MKTWKELVEIAESMNPPNEMFEDDGNPAWKDVVFDRLDGWKIVINYDGGEVDYISHFVDPEGNVIDFWEWEESENKRMLMCWRGVGSLKGAT